MGACTSLVEDVMAVFHQNLQVHAAALDIQAAYNSVWMVEMLEKMVAKRVGTTLILWVQSFLSRRYGILEIRASQVEVARKCVVP